MAGHLSVVTGPTTADHCTTQYETPTRLYGTYNIITYSNGESVFVYCLEAVAPRLESV